MDSHQYIVSEDAFSRLRGKLFPVNSLVIGFIDTSLLLRSYFCDPFFSSKEPRPILHASWVVPEKGTGIVHIAPAHGHDDFELWMSFIGSTSKYTGTIVEMVDDNGCFNEQTPHSLLHGKDVLSEGSEGTGEQRNRSLLGIARFIHRSIPQWHIELDPIHAVLHNELLNKKKCDAINRIAIASHGRSHWCVSRQRFWGVPIPVFYDKKTGDALLSPVIIEHVAQMIENAPNGSDIWWQSPISSLLPPEFSHLASDITKGTDTLDCWFDSGTAWSVPERMVGKTTTASIEAAIDMVVEGNDQLRGWFQSMMLTSVATTGIVPFKDALIHGFVLDQNGVKMSKSIGNVIDPIEVIQKHGIELLRLWVASTDPSSDVKLGSTVIGTLLEQKSKIRNTVRFLIANIGPYYDMGKKGSTNYPVDEHIDSLDCSFQHTADSFDAKVDVSCTTMISLPSREKYILSLCADLISQVNGSYNRMTTQPALYAITGFCTQELSSFYFEMIKDILYCDRLDSFDRVSILRVLRWILKQLEWMLFPVLPYTSFQIKRHMAATAMPSETFIFDESFSRSRMQWTVLRQIRHPFNCLMEKMRQSKIATKSEQCQLEVLVLDSPLFEVINGGISHRELLSFFQVAHLFIKLKEEEEGSQEESGSGDSYTMSEGTEFCMATEAPGQVASVNKLLVYTGKVSVSSVSTCRYKLILSPSPGSRCPRCWFHCSPQPEVLCSRCALSVT